MSTPQPSAWILQQLQQLIERQSGIQPETSRLPSLYQFAQQRAALQRQPLEVYLQQLSLAPANSPELNALLARVVINETFFFRDFPQLSSFAEDCLSETLKRRSSGSPLRVWSAACSIGEEAYTLAIVLAAMLEGTTQRFRIWATDLDDRCLSVAKAGIYSRQRAERTLPTEYLQRYFVAEAPDQLRIQPALRQTVEFQRLNLVEVEAMRRMRDFDFVFCKNVLFYFSAETQKQVLRLLYDAVRPGGYLFLSLARPMARILPELRFDQEHRHFYRKPL